MIKGKAVWEKPWNSSMKDLYWEVTDPDESELIIGDVIPLGDAHNLLIKGFSIHIDAPDLHQGNCQHLNGFQTGGAYTKDGHGNKIKIETCPDCKTWRKGGALDA